MKYSNRLYNKNQERFAKQSPLEARQLDRVDCCQINFCRTAAGELNLLDTSGQQSIYLYSQEGAIAEAKRWAAIQPSDKEVFFVYGVGLGYYYLPLKEWLKENPRRRLVFLEDDARILYRFLQTEIATEILDHPQVTVQFLPTLRNPKDTWAKIRVAAAPIIWSYALHEVHIAALQTYFFWRFDFFNHFAGQWLLNLAVSSRRLKEFPEQYPVMHNLYANMPYLDQAIPGKFLYGKFWSKPAVICGAGPSLLKQLPLLRQLQDKALILASGSAMNAVTRENVIPHAGGSIDPTRTQASRVLTSFGFDVPTFYQNRFHSGAFHWLHGPRIRTTGVSSYNIEDWFEQEIGLSSEIKIIMGVTTTNYLIDLAGLLGCNPIVLIGVDLAYTDDKRYAESVSAHPLDERKEYRELTRKEEKVTTVPGIDGKEVVTKYEWCKEAISIIAFALRNRDITILNATEGGMSMTNIPNTTFRQAVDDHLKDSWDMQGWLHGLSQNASKHAPLKDAVLNAMRKWQSNLQSCHDILKALKEDLLSNQKRMQRGEKLRFGPYTGRASLWQVELHEQPVYNYLLNTFDVYFETLHKLEIEDLKRFKPGKATRLQTLSLEVKKIEYLQERVDDHIAAIKRGLDSFENIENTLQRQSGIIPKLKDPISLPEYRTLDGFLAITDPEWEINIKTPFNPAYIPAALMPKLGQKSMDAIIGKQEGVKEGQSYLFYPDGQIQVEAFYKQGKLHGPWTFYGDNGLLLARSWFVENVRQGKSAYFYRNGSLYSFQSYRNGVPHGKHIYYYQDGRIKSDEMYQNGLLEGAVRLYYSNGQLKKELHFLHGKQHGVERLWNEAGTLLIEATYEYNRPIGTSYSWHPNGRLAKKVIHGITSDQDQWQEWDEQGILKADTRQKNEP